MITPKKQDAVHKAWLYRLLTAVLDDIDISSHIVFKGGTCAAMLGWLDRFSIDLDFDLHVSGDKKAIRKKLHRLFAHIGLQIKDESREALQFFLKYQAQTGFRNTIKLELIDNQYPSSKSAIYLLSDINRQAVCQTRETMFAHKLVALTDRYQKHRSIAGRDIYDIHHFFINGYEYNQSVITERTALSTKAYLKFLIDFINSRVSQRIIDQDLNTLLPYDKFKQIKNIIKQEAIVFIQDEIKRIS